MTKWIGPTEEEQKQIQEAEERMARSEASRFPNRQQRLQLNAKVTIRSQTNFFMGFSENISEGGIFISTLSAPAIGEQIEVKIPSTNGEDTIDILGTVRWHRRTPDGTITGCGVQFSDLSLEAKQSIEEIIRILRKEPLFVDI